MANKKGCVDKCFKLLANVSLIIDKNLYTRAKGKRDVWNTAMM